MPMPSSPLCATTPSIPATRLRRRRGTGLRIGYVSVAAYRLPLNPIYALDGRIGAILGFMGVTVPTVTGVGMGAVGAMRNFGPFLPRHHPAYIYVPVIVIDGPTSWSGEIRLLPGRIVRTVITIIIVITLTRKPCFVCGAASIDSYINCFVRITGMSNHLHSSACANNSHLCPIVNMRPRYPLYYAIPDFLFWRGSRTRQGMGSSMLIGSDSFII